MLRPRRQPSPAFQRYLDGLAKKPLRSAPVESSPDRDVIKKKRFPMPNIGRWFWRSLEFLALLTGLVAFVFFARELAERQEARIAQAWQLLTTPAPGHAPTIEHGSTRRRASGGSAVKQKP